LGGDPTTLIRLNGPHPNRHTNQLAPRVRLPVTPHVHYLTERYQKENAVRPRIDPTGFALCTTAYRDLSGAMTALARRAHIVPAAPSLPLVVGRLP
jgi:hypothetical protein